MIKFFRKIRQGLFVENQFRKYLLYAIGEIVLVIIGILIALSVNNWNTNRILKIKEQNILIDLQSEVNSNLEALDITINAHKRSLEAVQEFKNLFENREVFNSMSEAAFHDLYIKMFINFTYNPSNSILKSMISAGQIDNLSNKELKYLLASLQDLMIDASESTMKLDELRHDISYKFNHTSFIIENNQIVGRNYKRYYDNPNFRVLVGTFSIFREEGINEEKELREKMSYIVTLIDNEIKK